VPQTKAIHIRLCQHADAELGYPFHNHTARMEIKKMQNEASLQNLMWSLQKFQVH